ncbi:hypothetical protein EMIHUDRAFT_450775 [Emiliania huxleyi CCMP1516]|uniref:EF-hand domain-containing protein n=2 Tax=Emiliania huxleyi TaxID=2903 RepID=A0A0D3JDP1_EMIH1|nr:hypothetical protein EMIHUDRAFT_450775 [Emiliania huxleyi CCMP1516]EOD21626.1 hypothetical protein EMIHUDRAFT_450775 [Emiliania huxleyi CCMP1516]|eukprot:XP_005774055.1 hypothetical protein EMIHUDRAFT_450775 [Emiliania huxleyi CCMP1516]
MLSVAQRMPDTVTSPCCAASAGESAAAQSPSAGDGAHHDYLSEYSSSAIVARPWGGGRAPAPPVRSGTPAEYPDRSPIRGFLIDLDGTMYEPEGLLPGAAAFYDWLNASRTPHVFLSNTGAKNSGGVQKKFGSPPFELSEKKVPLSCILTAAETQVDYLLKEVPRGARLFVVSGGSGTWREDLLSRGGAEGAALVGTWDVRTSLSAGEAKAWAAHQALCRHTASKAVWVVFFHDGEVGGSGSETKDWSFELVYTADDAYNPSVDPDHPGLVFPLPGPGSSKQLYMNERHPLTTSRMAKHRPGMFAGMMRTLMYPAGSESVACAGKGGNRGGEYMMERARQMLVAQGHDGDPSTICMVGDRFDTDIRAGVAALRRHYPSDVADYFANGVGELVPQAARPDSLREESLTGWSSLIRSGRGDAARAALRPVLQRYFDAIDVNGDGVVDEAELMSGLEQVGLGRLVRHSGGGLSSSQFSLCECGVGESTQSRKRAKTPLQHLCRTLPGENGLSPLASRVAATATSTGVAMGVAASSALGWWELPRYEMGAYGSA